MTVRKLIDELLSFPPDAPVAIDVSEYAADARRVLDADPRGLHFLVIGRAEVTAADRPDAPPVEVVVIQASLDGRFLDTEAAGDPDLAAAVREMVIPPESG